MVAFITKPRCSRLGGTEPKARVTYVANWHDGLGRVVASADYGTNGGTALTRPDTVPASSDTVLVSTTSFDAAGEVATTTDPAGMVTKYEFDDAGRQTKLIENYQPSSSSSSSSAGTGCPNSDDVNRTTVTTYTPDGDVATLVAWNATTGNQTTTYTYGTTLAGYGYLDSYFFASRVRVRHSPTAFGCHHNPSRLRPPVSRLSSDITESTGPAWVTPAYDPSGNMTTIPKPADPTQGFTAVYDAWNRLVKLSDASGTVQENQYDGRNFRVVRKDYSGGVRTETRHFYYTSAWQVLEERVDSSSNPDRQFVWGLRYIDDCILRDRDTSRNGILDERLYALQDGNWNVTAVCDASGDVQERYAYTAYGEPLFLSPGFVEQSGSSFEWEVLFTGQRWDGGSGLYLFRMRVYCAGVGVFVQRDPAGYVDGENLCIFLLSRPLSLVDPSGLKQDHENLGVFFDGAFRRPSEKNTVIQQLHRSYKGKKAIFYTGIEFQGEGVSEPAQTFSKSLTTVCEFVCKHIELDWVRKIAKPKSIPKIDLFGWSWGATIANTLAAHLKLRGCNCRFTHKVAGHSRHTRTERVALCWKPVQIRFLGLIDPVSTGLDAAEATIIPKNVKNAAIAYAGTRDRVGRIVFVADVLRPEDSGATKLVTKTFPFTHQVIGWKKTVRDWLKRQAVNAGAPL